MFLHQLIFRSNYAQASSLPFTLVISSASLPTTPLALPSAVDNGTDLLDVAFRKFSASSGQHLIKQKWPLWWWHFFARQRPAFECLLISVAISTLFPCCILDSTTWGNAYALQCAAHSVGFYSSSQQRRQCDWIHCGCSVSRCGLPRILRCCYSLYAVQWSVCFC